MLHGLRHPELPGCEHAAAAAAAARDGFAPAAALPRLDAGQGSAAELGAFCSQLQSQAALQRQHFQPLGPRCRLLARKFLNTTAAAALAATAPCDSAALVLNDGVCPGETQQQAARRRAWRRLQPLLLLLFGVLLLPVLVAAGLVAAVGTGRRLAHK